MEKLGIPTVTIATSEFIGLARISMESFGASDMSFVVVPHPMGMIKEDEIRAKADAAFPEILKAATQWKPAITKITGITKKPYPAETVNLTGTYRDINKLFFEKGWSLGLPVIPPTREAVQEMLKGTRHKAEEVVWNGVPPRMGIVTVELVAALGAMAGAKPEYMPLLLAIVEGVGSPAYNWRAMTTTTQKRAPFVLVNGPIRKELNIAYSTGAGGPGYQANVSVGYFLDLLRYVVGGAIPPDAAKMDQGWPGVLVAPVYGENEEANPWKEPYHVEKGFKMTDSVVTVGSSTPPGNNSDHASNNAEALSNNISVMMTMAAGGLGCFNKSEALLFLSPEHAATIAGDGWTKDQLRKHLWEKTRLPYWASPGIPKGGDPSPIFNCIPPKEFGSYAPDTLIPVFDAPKRFQIAVVGGPGKHSMVWSLWQPAVSVLVDKWR